MRAFSLSPPFSLSLSLPPPTLGGPFRSASLPASRSLPPPLESLSAALASGGGGGAGEASTQPRRDGRLRRGAGARLPRAPPTVRPSTPPPTLSPPAGPHPLSAPPSPTRPGSRGRSAQTGGSRSPAGGCCGRW